ncbi:MAG: cob(I)yrinic acid a,c-diamide adenosyltransferase [Aestuariivita sp.]|nr:cob(I)yrinic acid a,c-diamide adenosyltransferase [Aestuariivita sp.]MCY4346902.1 cob(I)yrinic acid a,c-diamide adenosyltransferase [Aestuariivita sp.]
MGDWVRPFQTNDSSFLEVRVLKENYKQEMQKRQAEQRAKVQQASDPDRGLILVHTGNGKGKSTSAFGVIVRALGWQKSVAVVQFIKGSWRTGERAFFTKMKGVTWHTMGEGFTWDTQDRERDTVVAQAAFSKASDYLKSGEYDLVVLDEINIAIRQGYLDIPALLAALEERANTTSVILTGRDAKPEICAAADLVTEMTEIKHPYAAGIKAQRGIDY